MKARKSFLLRLDPALYEAVERLAEQELRSVNAQIEFLLKQAVKGRTPASFDEPAKDGPGSSPANGG